MNATIEKLARRAGLLISVAAALWMGGLICMLVYMVAAGRGNEQLPMWITYSLWTASGAIGLVVIGAGLSVTKELWGTLKDLWGD